MSLVPVCFVEAIIPDESWEGTSEDSGVSSKRRMAGRRVEEGEGRVPRTAMVCVKVSYDGIINVSRACMHIYTNFGLECGQTRTP